MTQIESFKKNPQLRDICVHIHIHMYHPDGTCHVCTHIHVLHVHMYVMWHMSLRVLYRRLVHITLG